MAEADIIITSTSCPHIILSREEVETIVHSRTNRPLAIVDLAMPRDVDSAVRDISGVFLCDLDDLENVPLSKRARFCTKKRRAFVAN